MIFYPKSHLVNLRITSLIDKTNQLDLRLHPNSRAHPPQINLSDHLQMFRVYLWKELIKKISDRQLKVELLEEMLISEIFMQTLITQVHLSDHKATRQQAFHPLMIVILRKKIIFSPEVKIVPTDAITTIDQQAIDVKISNGKTMYDIII